MLIFGVWFLRIPVVSAQEIPVQGIGEQEIQSQVETDAVSEDPLRAAERAYTFDTQTEGEAQPLGNSSIWAIIRMILALALAAGAIYGVVFFIKRSSKKTSDSNPFLKILATAHLGTNRYAHIVAVGSKAWLLGSSDGGVNLIGEIDDKDTVNAMLLEDSKKTEEGSQNRFPDFLSMLRRLGAPAESRSSGVDDIKKRRERLKGL